MTHTALTVRHRSKQNPLVFTDNALPIVHCGADIQASFLGINFTTRTSLTNETQRRLNKLQIRTRPFETNNTNGDEPRDQ